MRRRFAFRLGRVLRVRAIEERVARALWSAAEADARAAEELCAEARLELAGAREELARELRDDPRPAALLMGHRTLDALGAALVGRREVALTRHEQAENLGRAWRERETSRRALEELEARQRGRHRTELERQENLGTDEDALLIEGRRRRQAREAETDSREPGGLVDETLALPPTGPRFQ